MLRLPASNPDAPPSSQKSPEGAFSRQKPKATESLTFKLFGKTSSQKARDYAEKLLQKEKMAPYVPPPKSTIPADRPDFDAVVPLPKITQRGQNLEVISENQNARIAVLEKQLESRNHELGAISAEFSSVVDAKNQTISSLNQRIAFLQNEIHEHQQQLQQHEQPQQQQQQQQQQQTNNHPMHHFSHRDLTSILDAKIHELATLKSDFEEQKKWYKNTLSDLEHRLKMQEAAFIEKSQEVEKLRQEKIAQENRFLLQVADMKRREQWKPERIGGNVPEQNLSTRVLQLESQEKSMMALVNALKVERAKERSAAINLQAELTQAHKEVDSIQAKLNLLNEPLVLEALGGRIQEGLVGLVFQKEEEIVTLKREVEDLRKSKQTANDRNEE
ncbi:hypothetical protein HDU82_007777 [Entophlyctis luteolus]|nr:hypothetical protein HDU82_007777 [Entophlyctis luteolus]